MAESTKQQREARRRQRQYEARVVVHDVEVDRARSDNKRAIIIIAIAAVLALASQLAFVLGGFTTQGPAADPAQTDPAATDTAPADPNALPDATVPPTTIAENREWTGEITFNETLALKVTIDGAAAPQAASNFIDLAQKDYFNNTACHRMTTEGLFVLQCGDPTGTGTGNPGYQFGPLENVPADGLYPAGTIAMANSGTPDSMGSQFFIVYEDTNLPGGYSVFGHVTEGLDQLKNDIVTAGVVPGRSESDGTPVAPATITAITLE
ncbi:peptidylprolyl isomerase [Gulosibacter macacae]|uniref:Peptidyl-prolyl cis-trans isomerase n=1 Tax=Gulosibacter macacae TaxID=2488791 RepID=A0A3P3VWW5_9MICO|nr:peptidylprolyl isomerase [Gulosibacter macacae]RRJ87302.1 peptidylprolyl isomerase [Gulosibacter macacae]